MPFINLALRREFEQATGFRARIGYLLSGRIDSAFGRALSSSTPSAQRNSGLSYSPPCRTKNRRQRQQRLAQKLAEKPAGALQALQETHEASSSVFRQLRASSEIENE